MKTPADLADYFGSSPKPLKDRATSLKRIATGLLHEVEGAESSGLSNNDKAKLCAAISVINTLGARYESASKILSGREKVFARTERDVKVAMQKNFNALTTIKEKVLIIAAINSHILRAGRVKTVSDLDFYFNDSLVSIAFSITRKAIKDKIPAATVVGEYWGRWQGGLSELETQYRTVIAALEAAP